MKMISLEEIVKTTLGTIGDCQYNSHDWHQSYLDPYDEGGTTLVKHFGNVLLEGPKPIPGEYRCLRCHAVGRYQDLPSTVSYEPVILRVR